MCVLWQLASHLHSNFPEFVPLDWLFHLMKRDFLFFFHFLLFVVVSLLLSVPPFGVVRIWMMYIHLGRHIYHMALCTNKKRDIAEVDMPMYAIVGRRKYVRHGSWDVTMYYTYMPSSCCWRIHFVSAAAAVAAVSIYIVLICCFRTVRRVLYVLRWAADSVWLQWGLHMQYLSTWNIDM